MAVCFWGKDIKKNYRCTYSITEDGMSIEVEYDIEEEIPLQNGMRVVGSYNYPQRDIYVVDSKEHKYYLVKNACYAGNSNRYAGIDSKFITTFQSHIFFEHGNSDKLMEIPENPKCSAIRVFSNDFIRMAGLRSYKKAESDEELTLSINKKAEPIDLAITTDKIKGIIYNDYWENNSNLNTGEFTINITPYIEIQFKHKQYYEDLFRYVFELELYMQLYSKEGFKVDTVWTKIDNSFYRFNCGVRKFDYKGNKRTSVDGGLVSFLKECYSKIDYACTTKIWLRNISYAVGPKARNIEDNFLLFYKFIECFYKSKNEKGIAKRFIMKSIEEHDAGRKYSEEELLKLSREIVCLRNHYVHSGYYIKNGSLRISKPKDDDGKYKSFTPYTATADVNWIYSKTELLNNITIDIIYKDILGYKSYCR